MQKLLRKKAFRDLKENGFRYLAMGILVMLGVYIVIGLVAAADTVIKGTKEAAEANHVEDGQFHLFAPLTGKERRLIEEGGVVLEAHFYLDYALTDGSVLRIYPERERIDLVCAESGRLPEKRGEILLEKRYCEEHHISVGDMITIGEVDFTVSGIGTSPDYEAPIRNFSDSAVNSEQFGIGFVTKDQYEWMRSRGQSISSQVYSYAYLLNGRITEGQLKETVRGLEITDGPAKFPKMLRFVSAEDNPRIGSAADDEFVNKAAGLAAGVIVFILFAYVISVFTAHHMEKEAGVIGVLYAMGVKRKELLRHYLTLPVAVTFIAGVTGTILGYSRFGINVQMSEPYGYFSIPEAKICYEPYLLLYGVVMPPLVALLTNDLIIRKSLGRPVLALIRRTEKNVKAQKIPIRGSFVHVFRIRQLYREKRTAVTMLFGMLISLLIVMLALDCYTLCSRIKKENAEDTKFEYMYTYKQPEETIPEGGEEAYGVVMKKENRGYVFDVTLLGIEADNPYFDAEVESGGNRVMISSAMAQKFRIHKGDTITLFGGEDDKNYTFSVDGIVKYSAGFFMFMQIDSMRALMGAQDDYYNVIFADHALPVDSGRLYSVLTKEEVRNNASVFVTHMKNMILMLLIVSVLIFTVVLYLLMKVMIDRSALSISMFKVFGYQKGEIAKLYLNGNFFIVMISAIVGIPLSKMLIDAIFPYMILNVACGMNLTFSWGLYLTIFLSVPALYVLINRSLLRRVDRVLLEQILKNRE